MPEHARAIHARAIVAVATLLLAPLVPVDAGAQAILPPAEYRALVAEGNSASQGRAPGDYAQGGASLSLLDFPQAAAIGRARGGAAAAGFEGSIAYGFTVDGPPAPFDVIPMWVSFALQASVSGGPGNAFASFSLAYADSGDFEASVDADLADPHPADLSETRAFGLVAGRSASIGLGIRGGSLAGSAQALADPYIFIDPGYLAEHPGYSVRVSGGVGNAPSVTPVPEPEAYALMLAGLGMLGTVARRRRRR